MSSAGSNVAADLDIWQIDRGTQRLIDHALRLGPVCTFTVRPGPPMRMSRKEVGPGGPSHGGDLTQPGS